jgi:hypothetical protein
MFPSRSLSSLKFEESLSSFGICGSGGFALQPMLANSMEMLQADLEWQQGPRIYGFSEDST